MTSSSNIANAYRAITHPSGFEAKRQTVANDSTLETALYTRHDNAILQGQEKLVADAKAGKLSKEAFVGLAGAVETFEASRADKRGHGLSKDEDIQVRGEMRDLARQIRTGKAAAAVESQSLSELYEDVASGAVAPEQAVEELSWRGQKAYGDVVAHRSGPVYFDERAKQRAALAKDVNPQAVSARVKSTSDGKYHPGTVEVIRTAIEIFPQLDVNNDGIVNRAEAPKLITSYQDLGLTAAQATTLYSQQDLVDALDPGWDSHEKLTVADLHALLPEGAGEAPAKHADEIMTQVSIRLRNQEKLGEVAEVPLYLSADGPNPLKVSQGTEGSCWFLGVLPTLTKDELQSAMVAREDGSFSMNLPNGISEIVTPLNEAERRVYSKGDGAWSGLLEKGVSQYLARTGDDITGGFASDGLKLMTGAEADGMSIMNAPANPGDADLRDREQLAKLLDRTMKAGGAIFTHAYNEDFDSDISLITGRNHAYTITGYDPKAEMVKLRNPWGNGEKADRDGVNDGNFTMSLVEYSANYSHMYVQRPGEVAA